MLRGAIGRVGPHTRRTRRWQVVRVSRFMARRFSIKHSDDIGASTSKPPSDRETVSSPSSSKPTETLRGGEETQLSRLMGWTVQNGAALRQRMDEMTAMAAARASRLGQSLNEITGYHDIELLKKAVVENERRMHDARQAAKDAKKAYDQAVLRRSTSQREVNDLLQRKSTWTEDDVMRFTRLVREDHVVEQEEARAKALAMQTDDDVDKQFNELMRSILSRYHEEQAWSDKIRSASTYGSLLALGLNLVVFISAIVVVEPWKRKRMVQSFEATVLNMHEEMKGLVDGRMQELVSQQTALQKSLDGMRIDSSLHDAEGEISLSVDTDLVLGASESRGLFQQSQIPITALAFVGAGAVGWILRSWVG